MEKMEGRGDGDMAIEGLAFVIWVFLQGVRYNVAGGFYLEFGRYG